MAKLSLTLLIITTTTLIMMIYSTTAQVSGGRDQKLSWVHGSSGRCRGGSTADCLLVEEEEDEMMMMESEVTRRMLATTQYISYRALQRNSVPCSRRGASYYNCQSGAEANPYSRGCTSITRCRS